MMAITQRPAHDRARALYRLRRNRDGASTDLRALFGEPGWDILLDLFIAGQQGNRLQVSSVCLDAGVPSTTMLRWLARLESEGLIARNADDRDGRRRFVELTDRGTRAMFEVLEALGPVFAV